MANPTMTVQETLALIQSLGVADDLNVAEVAPVEPVATATAGEGIGTYGRFGNIMAGLRGMVEEFPQELTEVPRATKLNFNLPNVAGLGLTAGEVGGAVKLAQTEHLAVQAQETTNQTLRANLFAATQAGSKFERDQLAKRAHSIAAAEDKVRLENVEAANQSNLYRSLVAAGKTRSLTRVPPSPEEKEKTKIEAEERGVIRTKDTEARRATAAQVKDAKTQLRKQDSPTQKAFQRVVGENQVEAEALGGMLWIEKEIDKLSAANPDVKSSQLVEQALENFQRELLSQPATRTQVTPGRVNVKLSPADKLAQSLGAARQ